MEHYRQSLTLDEWLGQVDAELGPPSAETVARVDAQLGVNVPPQASSHDSGQTAVNGWPIVILPGR
ncbi:MAG: hypothetical protein ACRDRI_01675 [Pseudonocardiaceae bacterium]